MIKIALILLAGFGASLALVMWLIRRAPEGHEGYRGFRYGSADNPQPAPEDRPRAARQGTLGARTAI